MVFRTINPDLKYDTDQYDKDYVPIEMKSGSVILIHGHFVHRSFKNLSDKPRDAYGLFFFS
jgi:ectoine hydroxylase-related dioxygenase (phytanoyl-CoA dioxygenase family)